MRHVRPVFVALGLAAAVTPSARALGQGDLQFTSFNADNESVAIVTMVDLAPHTAFYMTDNAWTSSGFASGESYHRYDSGDATIAAGTVIAFTGLGVGGTSAASQGTLTRESVAGSTSFGISQTAETLYLYTGSSPTAPTGFMTAITTGDLSDTDGSFAGTGLVAGVTAVRLGTGSDSADYIGPRSGGLYRIANTANWLDRGDGNYAALSADLTPFATPVPEPAFPWLAGVGLVALGCARRRTATRSRATHGQGAAA